MVVLYNKVTAWVLQHLCKEALLVQKLRWKMEAITPEAMLGITAFCNACPVPVEIDSCTFHIGILQKLPVSNINFCSFNSHFPLWRVQKMDC